MKATLEFELPMEREDFELAQNGHKYKIVLEDYDDWLRSLAKYQDKTEVSIEEARKKLREHLLECLSEYFV
jgi:hypothetical protein